MDIITLPVAQIDAGERMRPVDDDYARMIGASMAGTGQRAPIEVLPAQPDGRYPLIAGAHRLRGAVLNGIETMLCVVRDVSDLQAETLELEENLMRHDLNALDRAVFLARLKEIYEANNPGAKNGAAGRARQNDKIVLLVRSFTDVQAEKLGWSKRSVARAVARVRDIMPDVMARVRGTWIARRGAYLDAIARLEAAEQRSVVDLLLKDVDGTECPTVAEALRVVRQMPQAPADDAATQFNKLARAWKNAEPKVRDEFIAFLAVKHLDKLKLAVRRQTSRDDARSGEAA
jgi:ParB family chromosome partitioning protein